MKTITPNKAASLIKRLNATAAKIQDKFKPERGRDWYNNVSYNKTRQKEIDAINDKIRAYIPFLTEGAYNEILASDMCCDYEDFIG